MIVIQRVEPDFRRKTWDGYDDERKIRITLYVEDKNTIERAGHDVSSWMNPEPIVPVPIEAVLQDRNGKRRLSGVYDTTNNFVEIRGER